MSSNLAMLIDGLRTIGDRLNAGSMTGDDAKFAAHTLIGAYLATIPKFERKMKND